MSSILKALKKIEGRKVDKSLPAWPYRTGSLESMDRHIHRSRRRQKILGLLIVLCAIALAGKLYIGSRPDADNTALQNAPAPAAVSPEKTIQVVKSETEETVAATPRSVPVPEPSPQETSPETAPPSAASSPPEEETSPETSLPLIISPSSVETEETEEIEEIAATEESSTAAVEQTPPTTVAETFSTPPTDNAGLSLMALVWSPQPGSRFVVINGDIVREGGSIEDSTVVRIEEDYVVMRTGGITWKLK